MALHLSSKLNVSAFKFPAQRRVVRRAPARVQALFGGGGEGGGMGNLMENMKKAQALVQNEAGRVQTELAGTEFDGYDEDETVKIVFLGNQQPKSCELTQAAMECTAEELEKRIEEAMADAHTKSVAGMREKMGALAEKLGLPKDMSLPKSM